MNDFKMKTDIDIKDEMYKHIKGSALAKEVNGQLRKTLRPANSNKEDIVISMLSNVNGQIQEAYINVNVYVPDVLRDNQAEENTPRLRTLCKLSHDVLKVGYGASYRFVLESQRVLEVEGRDEHLINNRIIYETFPEGRDKGTSALTQKQQENQHNAVKGAVMNKNNRGGISFFSVAAGTKLDTLDSSNTDIFDSKNEENLNDTIALGLGIAGGLLNGSGSGNYSSQQNNLELLSAQIFQWIESIQAELNKCINLNIIKDSKNYVEIYYLPITHVNKKNMVGYAKELYLQGKGSLSLWASACGIPSNVFFALLDQELEMDVENKYPVHQTSFTMSKEDNKGGRPENTDSTNPSTVSTKANGGNKQKKPSTK